MIRIVCSRSVFSIAFAALGLLVAIPGASFAQRPVERAAPPSREVAQYSFAPIVRTAAPAVVNVYVRSRVKTFNSPFANDPFFFFIRFSTFSSG